MTFSGGCWLTRGIWRSGWKLFSPYLSIPACAIEAQHSNENCSTIFIDIVMVVQFLEMGLWGCATGRGRIFITELTIMWLHFHNLPHLLEWGCIFSGFWLYM